MEDMKTQSGFVVKINMIIRPNIGEDGQMRVQNYCNPLLDYLSNKYKITGNINKQKIIQYPNNKYLLLEP